MEHSNNYNPFAYIFGYNGSLSEDNVIKMIDVFMKNTKGEGEKDDFWSISASKLITAAVFLLLEESEYNAEFKDGKIIPGTRDFTHLNFFSVAEKLRKVTYPSGNQADGFFMSENEREGKFLSPLDRDFIELERRKGETLAGRYYKEFRSAPPETGQSILSTATARTQMFNLTAVADLTCTDTVHLETMGDKKTALFIIIPATSGTYNFLAAMMYTQIFDTLSNRANFKYAGTLPVHVRCIMDEFANIGQIPDFDKVIAFVRSMGMSLNVIIQNLAQLKARYEKTWEVITGNCDSLLFLGGKEESTLKYVSEALGKETIDVEAKNHTKGGKSNSTSESNSILGRELMTQGELSTMNISNCILMVRAYNPFFCDKYPLEKHPNFRFTEDSDKANAFDKSTVKVKTLAEFTVENAAKKETANQPEATRRAKKIIELISAEKEKIEVSRVILEFDSYAEIEMFADADFENDITEAFADEPKYGAVSSLESFDLGEPLKNYEKGASNDDDVSGGVYLEENYEEYVRYSAQSEIQHLGSDEIAEEFASSALETASETYGNAFVDTDGFAFEQIM
jgi:type IV secretion system protein VirD4